METNTSPVRTKNINSQKKTKVRKLHDIGFGNDFLDITPKVQTTKEKIDKMNLIKT